HRCRWRERLISELETDLIVALAGAAVRDGIASRGERDLDLLARDERPRGRRAEEVVLLVNRAGVQDRKEIVGRELRLRIDEMEIARAGAIRLFGETGSLFGLADVDRDRDDVAAVVFLQPRDDDRGVESARICERHFFD